MNGIQFVKDRDSMHWNHAMACTRIVKKAGPDFKISEFTVKDLKCSSGTVQEFFNFSVPYISENGLTEFNL